MKIGTVTWITYQNYGTVLQACALQQAVRLLGYENEILSDREVLAEHRRHHPYEKAKPVENDAAEVEAEARGLGLLRQPRRLLRALKARLDREGYAAPYEESQKAIAAFIEQDMRVRRELSPDRLAALNGDYDAFLCGSDQIWSLRPVNFNPYYFLSFAQKPKLAYAPSLGTERISDERAAELAGLLQDFSALSVRESRSAEQLSALLGREVSWVADPTLLHDRPFWEDFCRSVPKRGGKYLLCYFLGDRAWYFRYAEALAKRLGLRLLLLPSRWEHLRRGCVDTGVIGPREFVARFRDAAWVLTDSYHGSIFSLLFERDFQYLLRFRPDDPNSQNLRIESLFSLLSLEDRIVSEDRAGAPRPEAMDHAALSEKLAAFREVSRRYLADSLSAVQEDQP